MRFTTAKTISIGLALFGGIVATASAQFDLSLYQLTGTYSLPGGATQASEASAITWNWDTDTLFVMGDEGDGIIEISRTGQLLNQMTLTGFDDVEGLTYIGGGQFVLAEERIQDVVLLDAFVSGGSASAGSMDSLSFGPDTGNNGLEGISWDPQTNNFFGVKQVNPQEVYQTTAFDFDAGTITVVEAFDPENGASDLNLLALSDIATLSTVPGFAGADSSNLLILSRQSEMLLEVNRSTGEILSQLSIDFNGLPGDMEIEGVTIDSSGTIYLVNEGPNLFVLTQIPEPSAGLLFLASTLFVCCRRNRRRG